MATLARARIGAFYAAIGFLLLAAALASPSPVCGEESEVRPFAPATVVEGEPRECGRAYGAAFREGIHSFLEREIYDAFVGHPSSKEDLLAYAAACGRVLRTECPAIAAELEGIAEGSGLTFDEIVLIHLHEELYHRVPLPSPGHCTAVAMGPPDTPNGRTYIGQTWDWMQSVAGKSAVVEWRRKGGPAVLAYGFPGMPMGAGLNSEGIALCWTSAALGTKGVSPRVGIPSYALIAHLLAQKDIEGVIRETQKDKHAGWFTFVMADAEGNLVNIEGSPQGVAVERTRGRLVRVGYGTTAMTGTPPGRPVALHERCRKMYGLLDASKGRNDLGQLQAYFARPEHGICQGPGTIDIMVFDAAGRAAYLSRGASYGVDWKKYEFRGPP